jgi:hypothetical protein
MTASPAATVAQARDKPGWLFWLRYLAVRPIHKVERHEAMESHQVGRARPFYDSSTGQTERRTC